MAEPAVSAIVVNYNTSALALSCAASLEAQDVSLPDGSSGVEVVVIDNASGEEERERLRRASVRVLCNDENVGYGRALNRGIDSTGAKLVLFSNADTRYRPGALQAAADELVAHPECGAVGPRRHWDDGHELLLPPNEPDTPWGTLLAAVCGRARQFRDAHERAWARRAVRYWTATTSVTRPTLSGASILTRRDVIERVGGFDERFHLYFEDEDWCRRVRNAGYDLRCVPAAAVVHFYNQSAKLTANEARDSFAWSRAAYLEKHYDPRLRALVARAANAIATPLPPGPVEIDLGRPVEPPLLSAECREAGPWLFLLSPHESCVPAVGAFRREPTLQIPYDVWGRLAPGVFHARLLSLANLAVVRRWRWDRPSLLPAESPASS